MLPTPLIDDDRSKQDCKADEYPPIRFRCHYSHRSYFSKRRYIAPRVSPSAFAAWLTLP